jgi:type IV pilus assembly protein PilC
LWKARSVTGESQSGEMTATSEQEVVGQLRRRRLIVISVKTKPRDIAIPFGNRIRAKDRIHFTQQQTRPAVRDQIRSLLRDVESGTTLADAMRRQKEFFNDIYVSMVAAGEVGGVLDTILLRLAEYLEAAARLKSKVRTAMLYPAVVIIVAVIAIAILLVFVIPTFSVFFSGAGVALPWPTRLLVAVSDFLIAYWWALLAGAALVGYAIRAYYMTSNGRLTIDRLLLRLPLMGPVLRKAAIARFSRTLGTLVQSGVPILEGLEITARTTGNRVIENAVMESRVSIAGGDTISDPLGRSGVFPPMVVQMINVGEQTGGLDEMLEKIGDFYDDEVETSVAGLTSILEPVMIVVLGGLVGGMLVALYLPIFDLIKTVQ